MGDSTQNIVLGWGVGRMGGWAKPLVFPRKQQEESRQPTPLPNTGPFHKFGGRSCGLQKEKERRLAHLVGFGNCLALGEFPALNEGGNRTGDCNQTRLQDRSGLSFMKRSGVKPLELFIIMLGGSFWTHGIPRNT